MSLRSPLGRVLGLGSAKEGTGHWWGQRVSGAAMVLLGLWFAWSLATMSGFSHAEAVAFIGQPVNALLLLLLNDLNGLADSTLMILGSVLLVSRLLHYVMIVSRSLPIVLRPISMIGTLGTILASAILLLV